MSDDRRPLTELAAAVLQRAERSVPDGDRERTIALMMEEARAAQRAKTRRRQIVAVLAMAATVALVMGLRAVRTDPPSVSTFEPRSLRVLAGEVTSGERAAASSLQNGDRLHARTPAVLGLGNGTRVRLAGGTDLVVLRTGGDQMLSLATGSLEADVAKLAGAERFVVTTSDAEVEVRGTSFRVDTGATTPQCAPRTTTRVVVTEGVVVVRWNDTATPVAAGETWPSPCALEAGVPSATPAAPPSSVAAPVAPPPLATNEPRSESANALYATAVAARKAGDERAAVKALDELLARHPNGALTETAHVERMRALDTFDRDRAAAAARAYITRYPHGFARADAEAILALP